MSRIKYIFFEKLIDKLVDLTNKDVAVWKREIFFYVCKLGSDKFSVDNLQDESPVFYITTESSLSIIRSYRLRSLVDAILEQEFRRNPKPKLDLLVEAEQIKKEQKCMEACGKTLKNLKKLFPEQNK